MAQTNPIITTNYGRVRGRVQTSVTGKQFCSFQGIPYAKPPVGPLRFQLPQFPETWEGVRDALKDGNPAPAFRMITGEYLEESSEDCLYLNIYTPKELLQGPPKAVMFYIHGGKFVGGNSNSDVYRPDYLLERDVVVVTCNYRIGVLGFLSLNSVKCPGNFGLKDLVMALKWVQQNISHFGGDPNNVTTFGTSSGAAIVQYLQLSPTAVGLFHKGMAFSGSVLSTWGVAETARETAFALGALLGCKTEDEDTLFEFLKSVPAEVFVKRAKEVPPVVGPEEHFLSLPFVPAVEPEHEGAFLTRHPEDMYRDGDVYDVPFLLGGTDMEALVVAKNRGQYISGSRDEDYARIIPPDLRKRMGKDVGKGVEAVKKQYFNKGFDQLNFFKALSPGLFWTGIDKTVRYNLANPNRKSPTFLYYFTFDSRFGYYKRQIGYEQYPGASHADDIGYVFHSSVFSPTVEESSKEIKGARMFCRLLTNFAKYGNPTPGVAGEVIDVLWEPVSSGKMACLEISDEPKMVYDPEGEHLRFWRQLYEKYESSTQ